MMNSFENYVTVKKAAEILPLAEQTYYNWRNTGRNPQIFSKIGGRVLVNVEEVLKLMKADTAKAIEKSKRLGLQD